MQTFLRSHLFSLFSVKTELKSQKREKRELGTNQEEKALISLKYFI